MSIYQPGCPDIPTPTCSDCPPRETGRVRSIWLQKATYTFADITSDTEWCTAIANKNVYVFPYINGSAEQAEQLSDGFNSVPQNLDSYEYTLNLNEPNYSTNIDFWNHVSKANSFLVGYKTETLIHLSQYKAMIFPKAPVSADVKSKININLTIKFVQDVLIVPQVGPPTIFNQCSVC